MRKTLHQIVFNDLYSTRLRSAKLVRSKSPNELVRHWMFHPEVVVETVLDHRGISSKHDIGLTSEFVVVEFNQIQV